MNTSRASIAIASLLFCAAVSGAWWYRSTVTQPAQKTLTAAPTLTTVASDRTAPAPEPPAAAHVQEPDPRIALGREIFFDTSLSEPAGTSCASCHDPKRAYSGNHGSKIGVAQGSAPGRFARRNTPSLLYLKFVRKFHWHWEEDAPFPEAVGGFFWDGRSNTIHEVARQPLLNRDEMGNPDPETVARKLHAARYAEQLTQTYALDWNDPEPALQGMSDALEAFLTSDAMAPFSSKYDGFVRGEQPLSALEQRGLQLFRDGSKGGCDACHKLNEASPNPERSLFTDYGYEALAVPRNTKLPHNRDRKAYDRGLCEPDARHFPMDRDTWCSNFRTPSLRNVAVREAYMHNGAFTSLREVVSFYATRGTTPKRWYKSGVTFDDVPAAYREQVQSERVPYDRGLGDKPRLDDAEIDALVAFLHTLTDRAYD